VSRTAKWITAAVALLLAAALVLAGIYYSQRRRFYSSDLTMSGDRVITLAREDDGTVRMSWQGSAEDRFYTEIRSADAAADAAPLYSDVCDGPACVLPDSLPRDEILRIAVSRYASWTFLGREEIRKGEEPVTTVSCLTPPEASGLTVSADPDAQSALLRWSGREEDGYRLYAQCAEEAPRLLAVLDGEETSVRFGARADLPLPGTVPSWPL